MSHLLTPYHVGLAAGAYNACILLFNVGFTRSRELALYDPSLFSKEGQIGVLLWGLAYVAAGTDPNATNVWAAFAIEKLFYVAKWIQWHRSHDCITLVRKKFGKGFLEILGPLFHAMYGVGDFIFGTLFLLLWLRRRAA